jgi:hypothetical protein
MRTLLLLLSLAVAPACSSGPKGPEEVFDARIEAYRTRIQSEIGDAERADQLRAVLARVEVEFDRRMTDLRERRLELRERARQYETEEVELEQLYSELGAETRALRGVLEDGHFELRDLLSEREWDVIVGEL